VESTIVLAVSSLTYWKHKICAKQNYLLCILQKNAIIKIENDVDVQSEEDTFDMKIQEDYVPSAFCIEKPEPEVSLVFRWFCACVPMFCQFKLFLI
jgi:hypothetical protein